MKTQSTVYDICAIPKKSLRVALREYDSLLDNIREVVCKESGNYKVRVDVGNYLFDYNNEVFPTDEPRIHIILEGEDLEKMEDILYEQIEKLSFFYNTGKFTVEGRALTGYNRRLFNRFAVKEQIFSVKYDRKAETLAISTYPVIASSYA